MKVHGIEFTIEEAAAHVEELLKACDYDTSRLSLKQQDRLEVLEWWLDFDDPLPGEQVCLICGGAGGCSEGCEPPDPF